MPVEMLPMKMGMTPNEAWTAFRKAMQIPHDDRLQTIFFAGFSAGMGYFDGMLEHAFKDATREIAQLVGASEPQESAHKV